MSLLPESGKMLSVLGHLSPRLVLQGTRLKHSLWTLIIVPGGRVILIMTIPFQWVILSNLNYSLLLTMAFVRGPTSSCQMHPGQHWTVVHVIYNHLWMTLSHSPGYCYTVSCETLHKVHVP